MHGTALSYTEIHMNVCVNACACVCVSVCLPIFCPQHDMSLSLSGTIVALKHPFSRSETACIYPWGVWLKTRREKKKLDFTSTGILRKRKIGVVYEMVWGKKQKLGMFGELKQYKLIVYQETFPVQKKKQFYAVYLFFSPWKFKLILLFFFNTSDLLPHCSSITQLT